MSRQEIDYNKLFLEPEKKRYPIFSIIAWSNVLLLFDLYGLKVYELTNTGIFFLVFSFVVAVVASFDAQRPK